MAIEFIKDNVVLHQFSEEYREKIGDLVKIPLREETCVEDVLGERIDLGPKVLFVQGFLREAEPGSENSFVVEATADSPFLEVLLRWAGISDLEESASSED